MDVISQLLHGFTVALTPMNLAFCLLGSIIGTLIGVLPGIGPAGTIAILLPITFRVPVESTLIMLAGIYYGSMYGGSTTSILVNIPGEATSIVTTFDGYQMARQGRAGPALAVAAIGSFIAGTLAIVGLSAVSPLLSEFSLKLGPPEYFSLMILSLSILFYLTSSSLPKAVAMAGLGVVLASVGQDPIYATRRLSFGVAELLDGIDLIPLIMGLFGISEVLLNLEGPISRKVSTFKIGNLMPTWKDWAVTKWPILRGSVIGFFLGILPGAGGIISTFFSYTIEKKISKHPEEFGKGAIEGVAAPESANNAASVAAFIPLLTLGIPPNVVMAVLVGALMIHGVQPGPLMMSQHPDMVWGLVASMYIGNIMLLILNLPLIGLWVRILKIPYKLLFPLILLFCLIGAFAVNNRAFDIGVMLLFGVVGYVLRKTEFDMTPLVLTFILTPMMENSFRQALIRYKGDLLVFLTRPISAIFILITLGIMVLSVLTSLRKKIPRETE